MPSRAGRSVKPSLFRSVLGVAVLESKWVVRQPGWLIQDAFLAMSFALIL